MLRRLLARLNERLDRWLWGMFDAEVPEGYHDFESRTDGLEDDTRYRYICPSCGADVKAFTRQVYEVFSTSGWMEYEADNFATLEPCGHRLRNGTLSTLRHPTG